MISTATAIVPANANTVFKVTMAAPATGWKVGNSYVVSVMIKVPGPRGAVHVMRNVQFNIVAGSAPGKVQIAIAGAGPAGGGGGGPGN